MFNNAKCQYVQSNFDNWILRIHDSSFTTANLFLTMGSSARKLSPHHRQSNQMNKCVSSDCYAIDWVSGNRDFSISDWVRLNESGNQLFVWDRFEQPCWITKKLFADNSVCVRQWHFFTFQLILSIWCLVERLKQPNVFAICGKKFPFEMITLIT